MLTAGSQLKQENPHYYVHIGSIELDLILFFTQAGIVMYLCTSNFKSCFSSLVDNAFIFWSAGYSLPVALGFTMKAKWLQIFAISLFCLFFFVFTTMP